MRSPNNRTCGRLSQSGCRRCIICFAKSRKRDDAKLWKPCCKPVTPVLTPSANQRSVCARKRRHSEENEQSRMRGCERYGACDDEGL